MNTNGTSRALTGPTVSTIPASFGSKTLIDTPVSVEKTSMALGPMFQTANLRSFHPQGPSDDLFSIDGCHNRF